MGGMERASANTANGLSNFGLKIVFLSLFKKQKFFELNSEIEFLEPDNFNFRNLSFFKSALWIRREIKRHNPDSVLAFGKLYGAITAIALIGIEKSFYVSERSSPLFKWSFPLNFINFFAYLIRKPQGIIAQTEIAAKYQRKYYRNSRVYVIPNSVREVILFPTVKRENIILAVGRLNDYLKGFDLLFESIALLKNKEWKLHLIGGNLEDDKKLFELASSLGISHRIKLIEKTQNIDFHYASAGIFVIPSRSEGFPNALVEAMAAGCCCLSFDFVAGPRDIINDGKSGFIVPYLDTKKMSEMIDFLIENPKVRMKVGNEALQLRNELNIKNITNKLIEALNQ
jgi:glycosyltransferase involved in cell wall biosynthesis